MKVLLNSKAKFNYDPKNIFKNYFYDLLCVGGFFFVFFFFLLIHTHVHFFFNDGKGKTLMFFNRRLT